MTFFPSLGEDADLLDIYRLKLDFFRHWTRGGQYVMRGDGELTPGQREMIAAYVSTLNECDYCVAGHGAAAEVFGVDPAMLTALVEDIDTAPVDEKLKPIFRFAKKLTLTPARTIKADVDAILEAGWSEDTYYTAMLVICMFNFMNRLVDGSGVPMDAEAIKARAGFFKEQGYKFPGIYTPEKE